MLTYIEWAGVITAIIYSLVIALNMGLEVLGFSLLLASSLLLGIWSYLKKSYGILLLQVFYTIASIIGIVRWF